MFADLQRIKQNREEGFTLVELAVAVFIVGVLAAIAIPAVLNQRKASIDATVEGEVKSAALVIKSWSVSHPKGTPDSTVIASVKKHPETTFSITSSGPNKFVITGINPKGDRAKTGITFNSEVDRY